VVAGVLIWRSRCVPAEERAGIRYLLNSQLAAVRNMVAQPK